MRQIELMFIQKYGKPEYGDYWNQCPETVFWAASYLKAPSEMIEMSKDLLRCVKSNLGCSSVDLAVRTLKEHDKEFQTYGMASLYES